MSNRGFPNDSVGEQPTCNTGDTADVEDLSLIPGSGISPGGGNGNPLQPVIPFPLTLCFPVPSPNLLHLPARRLSGSFQRVLFRPQGPDSPVLISTHLLSLRAFGGFPVWMTVTRTVDGSGCEPMLIPHIDV